MKKAISKGKTAASVPVRDYSNLLGGVSELLESARRASARAVNALMTATYWEVGRRIVEFEQGGEKRAEYGEEVLKRLADDLTARFGRGFSRYVLTMNFTPREFETFALRANDILLNEGQSLHMVGRPALYRDELPGACFQNTLVRFRPGPEVDPRFALTIFRGYMHIRTNGSKSLIGRSAVVRDKLNRPTSFASYLIRFRLHRLPTLFEWVATVWDVPFLRAWIEERAATSAGQYNISMSVLNTMPIPVPPLAEQTRIIEEVERRLSVVDELEVVVSANLQRATRLRQSILQKAFTGELV